MSDFIARYAAARKAAIARDFAKLNPEQRRGVLTTEGASAVIPRLEEALRTGAPLRLPTRRTRMAALEDEALPAPLGPLSPAC